MAKPRTSRETALLQQEHYDRIAVEYEAHYADRWSLEYRDRFINPHLFAGLDLAGLRLLDAMAGSGPVTDYALRQGALVTGLDVSPAVVASYREKHPAASAVAASILETGFEDASFDCVAMVGGLHHLHPHVDAAMVELARILRPGGWLVMAEPHRGSLLDLARRAWYRFDPLFEDNERSLDIAALAAAHRERFELVRTRYVGGVAYLTVLSSMVLRMPLRLKPLYAPALMALESATGFAARRRTACIAVAQMRRTG